MSARITMRQQPAFTLLELLITLLIVSLILLSAERFFVFLSRQNLQIQAKIQHDYEQISLAKLLISRIQQAGFSPCGNLENLEQALPRIQSLNFANGPAAYLELQQMSPNFIALKTINPPQTISAKGLRLKPGDTIILADCYHAESKRIESLMQGRFYLSKPLHFSYPGLVYIGKLLTSRFYLKRGKNGPALFYQDRHADLLMDSLQGMHTERIRQSGVAGLRLRLLWAENEEMALETRFRNR